LNARSTFRRRSGVGKITADVAQADAQALPYPTPRSIACSPRSCSTTFRIDRQRSMSSGGRLRQADAWCWPRTGRTTGRSVPADSVKAAAVGVCLHIAWVAGVALIGSGYDAELAYRGRLELVTDPMPAQAYPAAAEGGLSLPKATELIRSRLDQASASARAGLRQLAPNLETAGADLRSCALFVEPTPLPPLEQILTSHPLLHAGEGQMSREALYRAAEAESLPVIHVVPERAAPEAVVAAVAGIGRIAGPPWAADQRRAAAAAWAALS